MKQSNACLVGRGLGVGTITSREFLEASPSGEGMDRLAEPTQGVVETRAHELSMCSVVPI